MRQILLVFIVFIAFAAAATEVPPESVVRRLDDALLEAMKLGPHHGFAERAAGLGPAFNDSFDMSEMTRSALGSYAGQLSPAELDRLQQAFRRFTVASYASQFDAWNGESFQEDAAHPSTGGQMVVPVRMLAAGGQASDIDYVLHRASDGTWKIVDVLLNGAISQIAVRRSEFVSVYRRQRLDGLIDLLDNKTSALAINGQ